MLKTRLIENIKRDRKAYTQAVKLVEGMNAVWVHEMIASASVDGRDGNFIITLGRGAQDLPFHENFLEHLYSLGYELASSPPDGGGNLVLINTEIEHVVEIKQAVR